MEQLAIIVVITLFVFLLIREIVCWYFKINVRNELLKDIKRELERLNYNSIEKSIDLNSKHD
tara:strand:+ start:6986 stop:7171 length:186 start_codon:yes stop_codon:yes gene_type:complete